MIDIVMVLRAEDAVLDFSTVLTAPDRPEVRVVVAGAGDVVVLSPDGDPLDALAALGQRVRPGGVVGASPGPDALTELIDRTAGGAPARVWTHSPGDNRRSRGRLGRDAAIAAAGRPVRHAVGYSPFLQYVSDEDRPLTAADTARKTAFVNRWCGGLLAEVDPEYLVDTSRIPAVERFFAGDAEERERLFALLASLGDEAAAVADPWEFATSPYEQERLDATTAWAARWVRPDDGPLVEVGACEGALTGRLEQKGFRVLPTEPNGTFRTRLDAARPGAAAAGTEDLAALAAGRHRPAAAYLLVEMLYYGQDLGLLDALPTDTLLVALEPGSLTARVDPWLAGNGGWREVERVDLVGPAVEAVCLGRAYLSKRGSTGLVLRRRTAD
ncbi:SAM-dependent methyltransferase [Streptomyces bohaiensis]|uniref:Class I SAM-dependent methyltransferase n=1 Tax=Streptomyces bohaiensis TaxID=1431344 RepID=A0ABX1CEM8_9ACTN|nr:SAM-dependent methyltransferase [Streptomyces bohaiensis]NJQ15867.1 hypothetical protein [Streptomyces bohaiensis]